jgi:hypothetical protein
VYVLPKLLPLNKNPLSLRAQRHAEHGNLQVSSGNTLRLLQSQSRKAALLLRNDKIFDGYLFLFK